ncbi:glucosylceramidase [Flavobacterium magnum]|uniref:Glucosylceramidase n=1 Tax=Flavobacterium magnum TaxID=2162713 RepID=A0A2S0RFQ7_9FLAO|nr:glycoside hydrolase family 30 beta sandwich domain-containing protein [Flavobacterium magnum]AWA29921.1 glucosylceramidase [Flavobacterium magnum]
MKLFRITLIALLLSVAATAQKKSAAMVSSWMTKPDRSMLLQPRPALRFENVRQKMQTIYIDETKTFQQMDGFGYCLTGGSAQLISKMGEKEQQALLDELFGDHGNSISVSYLRVSIGASDLDDHVFSYDDLPEGETDPELAKFSLQHDYRTGLIPLLKKIVAINPTIKIMGSPWSAPVWMKTNGKVKGGSLKPEFYKTYAYYFVNYIQGMQKAGIPIDAVTVQNEPLHPGNTPSMYMEARDQAEFIKSHLGPAFREAGIRTKIVLYDHNCDRPDYPISIMDDPEAKQYVDGSGFHLYGGEITAMTAVHDAHPDKNLYFTEQWNGGPEKFAEDLKSNVGNLVIAATRNWAKTVLQWNLAADPQYRPHTDDGGCTSCLGAITIDGNQVTRNVAYYSMAHAAMLVPAGSRRIASNVIGDLQNVAFVTPDGRKVLIVLNSGPATQTFFIKDSKRWGKAVTATLESGAVASYLW